MIRSGWAVQDGLSGRMKKNTPLNLAFQQHSRRWSDGRYCYPVVSRRSEGLSVGINLNPDKACNFDCIYCQVDRSAPPLVRKVDLALVREELDRLLEMAAEGSLFREPPFDSLPAAQRVVRDIAFSGDGEPTTYPQFEQAVELAADARRRWKLESSKLVLITDSCYLTKPNVREGLRILDANNGEIWAKLDAGTEAYFRLVDRPNFSLGHVLENIIDAARARPLVIQSLFMRVHGAPPPEAEVAAYCDRLNEVLLAGGRIKLIQVYTIARRTAEPYATALADHELDAIAGMVRARVAAPLATYYGIGG